MCLILIQTLKTNQILKAMRVWNLTQSMELTMIRAQMTIKTLMKM